jgi:quinol monooxygenase YgiN
MIQVTYEVAEADRAKFIALMHEFAASRRRNGGYGWSLMQDGENRNVLVETWQEPSWLDHLRHHERVTGADQRIQAEILALHRGKDRPIIRHLVTADG